MTELLEISDLGFTFTGREKPALDGISFSMREGEFRILCGPTGSGKSTLLRCIKRELTPGGRREGRILLRGKDISLIDAADSASLIAFVPQDPEAGTVTDSVRHELAFGPESLGIGRREMALRIAELSAYFGLDGMMGTDTSILSGGEKQLLNLAAAMIMRPSLLILDEPTSQLDPVAAGRFISTLVRLNRETGTAVLISEHRLADLLPEADSLLLLDGGRAVFDGAPRAAAAAPEAFSLLERSLPAAARLYVALGGARRPAAAVREGPPLTVKEGRDFIRDCLGGTPGSQAGTCDRSSEEDNGNAKDGTSSSSAPAEEPALSLRNLCFRFSEAGEDLIHGLDLDVGRGEFFCILGGNGSGKTTLLNLISGILRPHSGSIRIFGKNIRSYRGQSLYRECLALLPQDVRNLFLRGTVREELAPAGITGGTLPGGIEFSSVSDTHPYDLSGGEAQSVALAKILASKPKLLLLDEPTKGLDADAKYRIAQTLKELAASGVTVVAVTHDCEFAAEHATRCALLFDGCVAACGSPSEVFGDTSFYTTDICRIFSGIAGGCVSMSGALEFCEKAKKRGGASE